jgi:hypothetical protein
MAMLNKGVSGGTMAAQDYREKADKLREQAKRAKDSSVREQLLLMAADWDKMADDAGEAERRRAPDAK